MFSWNKNRSVYIASMAGVAVSLPLSEWLLSVFMIILSIFWIADGGIIKIPLLLSGKRNILIFLVSYIIYMVWMINTSDLHSGLNQLRLKLPLVIFPLVVGLSEPLGSKELRLIVAAFILGAVLSSLAGVITGLNSISSGIPDPAMLSPFISHIRLALMSVFAIACSGWYFLYCRSGKWHDWLYIAAAIWLIVFLFLLVSITGIFLFIITLAVSSVAMAFRSGNPRTRISATILISILFISISSVLVFSVKSFYKEGTSYIFPLIDKTDMGNAYSHEPQRKDIENGNLVWIYLCEEELRSEWNRFSSMKFDGNDNKGQVLKFTLIRYMTSAGLTKDSTGFSAMTPADIRNVEKGITNRNFLVWIPWRSKAYEIIWQIDYFRNGGNPSGHSITQRLVYARTGLNIFLRNPLFGTGTGDLRLEYQRQYEDEGSVLDNSHRLLSHNQFLTFLVSFGIIGTIIIVWSLFFPFVSIGRSTRYLPAVFMMLLVISMLWEDTLETHTGVSFFAYFYSVFIFGNENNESQDKEN